MKAIAANLGFILQTSGVITLLAVVPGFIYGEQTALIAFFITSSLFLVFGFAMNALSERKELDFKSSCILISIVFLLLGVIGAVPYLYTNTFSSADLISKVVNSFFESASGYTTTGFSMITNPSLLPKSMVFYRALTQWIGGIGIVFIILVFFNSAEAFEKLGKAIGFGKISSTMKNTYLSVFGIYAAYTLVFFGILYAAGLRDWINNISAVFSGISTGGFSPVDNFSTLAVYPVNLILGLLMIIGATSFSVHYRLFSGKFKQAQNFEFVVFIGIVIVFTLIFALITGNDLATSFFHITSASSTTGYSYIDLGNLAANAKLLLIILMFIGASTYSTAGGVKIKNVYIFFKSIPWLIRGVVSGELANSLQGEKN